MKKWLETWEAVQAVWWVPNALRVLLDWWQAPCCCGAETEKKNSFARFRTDSRRVHLPWKLSGPRGKTQKHLCYVCRFEWRGVEVCESCPTFPSHFSNYLSLSLSLSLFHFTSFESPQLPSVLCSPNSELAAANSVQRSGDRYLRQIWHTSGANFKVARGTVPDDDGAYVHERRKGRARKGFYTWWFQVVIVLSFLPCCSLHSLNSQTGNQVIGLPQARRRTKPLSITNSKQTFLVICSLWLHGPVAGQVTA